MRGSIISTLAVLRIQPLDKLKATCIEAALLDFVDKLKQFEAGIYESLKVRFRGRWNAYHYS
jgi:hypothetical protein